MARITKQFNEARLITTTKNLRKAGVLGSTQSLVFDDTGSSKPWCLRVVEKQDNGGVRVNATLTGNITWGTLCEAIDAIYELSWIAVAGKD